MPKMKTKSSCKKRFKVTAKGRVVAGQSRQAPRHDQTHQQVHPQRAWHHDALQG